MLRTVSAIAAAAAFVGAAIAVPGMTPEVSASANSAAVKSARADNPIFCEHQGWPYYGANCLRDESRNAGRVSPVRVITIDRVGPNQPAAPASEPLPLQMAQADMPAHPLSVPAWPEYLNSFQALITR